MTAPAQPYWLRALNAGGRALRGLGIRPGRIDVAQLVELAERRTGLADWGDDEFETPLRLYVDSLEQDSHPSLVGRLMTRSDLLTILEQRLQIVEVCKRHPEIEATEVREPIIVTGFPRSGTSILHELLAQDADSRVPLSWEVRFPCPPPTAETFDSDPRIDRAQAIYTRWGRLVPAYGSMHENGARIPAECGYLTAFSLVSDMLWVLHDVRRYRRYVESSDMQAAFRWHRRVLQVLQWRTGGKRWVLKAPTHMYWPDAIMKTYPNARFVQTHRDPLRVAASLGSLALAVAWMRSDSVDEAGIRREYGPDMLYEMIQRMHAARDSGLVDSDRIVDVRYQDLMEDPEATLSRVYDELHIPFSEETRTAMAAYLRAKPRGRDGVHRYSFAETAPELEEQRRRFSAYMRRYRVSEEPQDLRITAV